MFPRALTTGIYVTESGRIRIGREARDIFDERSVIEVDGWVHVLARERGKIVPGSRRDVHNVFTNTGREFLSMLMSYQAAGSPFRNDRVAYLGVGSGSHIEEPGVISLASPLPYTDGMFLAPIDIIATTFPLSPARTSVRYSITFSESEITFGANTNVLISELGLFTDGEQSSFVVGARDRTLSAAPYQSPISYKNLGDPVEKTSSLELQIEWEYRY